MDGPALNLSPLLTLLESLPRVGRCVVACSGGADSLALLTVAAAQRELLPQGQVWAVHVDHGLHPQSAAWAAQLQRHCERLGVVLATLRVDARAGARQSREARAREARYAAIRDWMRPHDAILTAHHADDQAETVLLQLLRGAGPHGLAAMPAVAALGGGWLLRPWLHLPQSALRRHARAQRLDWVEDPSNADTSLRRNLLRLEVLPHLRAVWPAYATTLGRSATLCGEAALLLDRWADGWLEGAFEGPEGALPVSSLLALDPAQRRQVLRRAIARKGLALPDAARLTRIASELLCARTDAQPLVQWPGGEARRHAGRLYLAPPTGEPEPEPVAWTDQAQPLALGDGWLRLSPALGAGLDAARLRECRLEVRFRVGGERLRPAGSRHHRTLKALLQQAAIPPWQRGRLPLLYADGQLVAVAGLCCAHGWQAEAGAEGRVLEWQNGGPSGTF